MLRLLLGVTAAAVLIASCGSDDPKRKLQADAGGAGAGGAPDALAGSPIMTEGGAGGVPSIAAGGAAGAEPAVGGASGAGSPALAGAGGAAGASNLPVSACGDGMYDSGEGVCAACDTPPQTVMLACTDFYMPVLNATGSPLSIHLSPFSSVREPFPGMVDVKYVTPDQIETYPLIFDSGAGHWSIDISAGPDDPSEVIVQPFSASGACGDTYMLTDPVGFSKAGTDLYVQTCPS